MIKKLKVISVAARSAADRYAPSSVEEALKAKPVPIECSPHARPVFDPRPFLEHVGRTVEILLRNGATFRLPLVAAGSFDLLLGAPGEELFVPLHALMRWQPISG